MGSRVLYTGWFVRYLTTAYQTTKSLRLKTTVWLYWVTRTIGVVQEHVAKTDPQASINAIFRWDVNVVFNHHHHISIMELGHLLTRSSLTYPEVSSKVCHDSFCQLGNGVSLPWVIYYGAFHLYVVSSFSCIPVICLKLVLFLITLQFVYLCCNLSECILLFFSCISSLLLLFFWCPLL